MNPLPKPNDTAAGNRWLIIPVCVCAVVLAGLAAYSYRLTESMQAFTAASAVASAPDAGAPANGG